jgi:hypothetical protein
VAKHATHAKARALAIGDWWDCCCAEALGASLRLAGWPVADDDVLALHVAAGGSEDAGVSILAALEAASVHGLAGIRLHWYGEFPEHSFLAEGVSDGGIHVPEQGEPCLRGGFVGGGPAGIGYDGDFRFHALILGLELPGPHAVCAETGRWWSWGQPWPPAAFHRAVVEEAWAVVWP